MHRGAIRRAPFIQAGQMTFTVSADSAGRRLDLLAGERAGLSRRRLNALFAAGLVRRNGRRAPKGTPVAAGDVIEIDDSAFAAAGVEPAADAPLAVVYEDADLAVIVKPAGEPTHPNRTGERGTTANAIVARWPSARAAGPRPFEPGLVHRLDTGTSGLLLVALSPPAYRALRRAFSAGAVEKEYLAVVEGRPPVRGVIDLPLGHHPKDARRMVVIGDARTRIRGKPYPAATRFETVRRGTGTALVRVTIEGGVMHQIRVHLAHAGFPVVGDALYGASTPAPGGRFLLHASRIALAHPITGGRLSFESPMPAEFDEALRPAVPALD